MVCIPFMFHSPRHCSATRRGSYLRPSSSHREMQSCVDCCSEVVMAGVRVYSSAVSYELFELCAKWMYHSRPPGRQLRGKWSCFAYIQVDPKPTMYGATLYGGKKHKLYLYRETPTACRRRKILSSFGFVSHGLSRWRHTVLSVQKNVCLAWQSEKSFLCLMNCEGLCLLYSVWDGHTANCNTHARLEKTECWKTTEYDLQVQA